MRILLLGGTGNISSACTRLALDRGHEVHLLHRGNHGPAAPGAISLHADLKDESAAAAALGDRTWDAVVDFIAFTPDDIERDIRPEMSGTLHGDKASSVVMDNTKLKRFVPGFTATTRFRDGVARSIAAFETNPDLRRIDPAFNQRWDTLIAAYRTGLAAAQSQMAALRNTRE